MTENKVIGMACLLGAVVLILMIIVIRPFSRFEEQYPMADASAASGGAVSGGAVSGAGSGAGDTPGSGNSSGSDAGSSADAGAATSDSATGIPSNCRIR